MVVDDGITPWRNLATQKAYIAAEQTILDAAGITYIKGYDAIDAIPWNGIPDAADTNYLADAFHPNVSGHKQLSKAIYLTLGPAQPTVPDATFNCLPIAGVRNSTRICTNSSQSDTVDYYGAGTNKCIGTNTTSPNPNIFPKNFSWCSICMIAATDTKNTSCLSLYTAQPQVGI
jgi:hypothetical protein